MQAAELKTFGEISEGIILFNEYARPYYLSPAASGLFWHEGSNDNLYDELVQTLYLVSESNLQLTYKVKLQTHPDGLAVNCSVARFGRGYRVVVENIQKQHLAQQ